MLIQKELNFLKVHKRTTKNQKKTFNISIAFFYGIIITSFGLLTIKKYEYIKKFIIKKQKKNFIIITKLFLNRTLTKKNLKSRMGKGSGNFNLWFAYVKPGLLLFELRLKNSFDFINFDITQLNKHINLTFSIKKLPYQFKFMETLKLPIILKYNEETK